MHEFIIETDWVIFDASRDVIEYYHQKNLVQL